MTKKAHCGVLFSGGTDSTLAACQMLDEFEKVTLLTFDPGFVFFLQNTRVHAKKMQDHYGAERVVHEIIDIRRWIGSVLGQDLPGDMREYGFNMTTLVCLGCRLSMHAAAIDWCLRQGVPYLADGSIRGQSSVPEQMETVIRRNRRFYAEVYGIHHFSPIYEETMSDRKLEAIGIADRKRLKKQFILYDTQGTCVFGVPADVYGKLFYGALVGPQREQDSEQYCRERYPMMEEALRRAADARGERVEDGVARLLDRRRRDGDLVAGQGAGEAAWDGALEAATRAKL
jgi:hypothetical protein